MRVCNHDCFNCPYPDCINNSPATASERAESKELDYAIKHKSKKQTAEDKKAYQRRYYRKNKEELKVKRHQRYLENREEELNRQKAYDAEHPKKRGQKT